jgi:hypothetical protein
MGWIRRLSVSASRPNSATGRSWPKGHPVPLAWVHIDRDRDIGEYCEPNIWIFHQAGGPPRRG